MAKRAWPRRRQAARDARFLSHREVECQSKRELGVVGTAATTEPIGVQSVRISEFSQGFAPAARRIPVPPDAHLVAGAASIRLTTRGTTGVQTE